MSTATVATLDELCDIIAQQPDPPGGMLVDVRIDEPWVVLDLEMGNRWLWKPILGIAIAVAAIAIAAGIALTTLLPDDGAGLAGVGGVLSVAAPILGVVASIFFAAAFEAHRARGRLRLGVESFEVTGPFTPHQWQWAEIAAARVVPAGRGSKIEIGLGIAGRPAFRFVPSRYLAIFKQSGTQTYILKNFDSAEIDWLAAVLTDIVARRRPAEAEARDTGNAQDVDDTTVESGVDQ